MADCCNISNYFLRDTKSKLAIPLSSRQMLRKKVSLEQFFGIALLYVDQQQAKSLIQFCDKDKGKVLEALILS